MLDREQQHDSPPSGDKYFIFVFRNNYTILLSGIVAGLRGQTENQTEAGSLFRIRGPILCSYATPPMIPYKRAHGQTWFGVRSNANFR